MLRAIARERRPEGRRGRELLLRRRRHRRDGARDLPPRLARPGRRQLGRSGPRTCSSRRCSSSATTTGRTAAAASSTSAAPYGSATVDPKRTIVWNADVYLLGEPNPRLIVDATGKIIAKSDNVTVRANGVGPALQIDDVFAPGTTIVIDPIIYDQKPTALFRANHHDDVASTISGTLGIFFMQETWNSVTVLNGSDRPMQLLGTGGAPERVDQHAQLLDVLVARSDHQRLGRRRRGGCGREPVAVRRQAHLPGDSRPHREHPRSAVRDSVLRRCLATSRSSATSTTSSARRPSGTTAATSLRGRPGRPSTPTGRSSTPSSARSGRSRSRSGSFSSRSRTPASSASRRRSRTRCWTARPARTCTSS